MDIYCLGPSELLKHIQSAFTKGYNFNFRGYLYKMIAEAIDLYNLIKVSEHKNLFHVHSTSASLQPNTLKISDNAGW